MRSIRRLIALRWYGRLLGVDIAVVVAVGVVVVVVVVVIVPERTGPFSPGSDAVDAVADSGTGVVVPGCFIEFQKQGLDVDRMAVGKQDSEVHLAVNDQSITTKQETRVAMDAACRGRGGRAVDRWMEARLSSCPGSSVLSCPVRRSDEMKERERLIGVWWRKRRRRSKKNKKSVIRAMCMGIEPGRFCFLFSLPLALDWHQCSFLHTHAHAHPFSLSPLLHTHP